MIASPSPSLLAGTRTLPHSSGFRTLLYKEVLRFWKVSAQTITAPILTSVLYLLIFSHVLAERVQVHSVSYTSFLIPGLIVMAMLQNAFANTSSSLIQSKMMGNLIFMLLAPIRPWHILSAYVLASIVRGILVGLGVFLATLFFDLPNLASLAWIFVFSFLGCALMGALGLLAAIWAEKFDHIAAFQNFLILPATFLSGVFYSIHSLPPIWNTISHYNPFLYMIDGFRYGFIGASDISPWTSLVVVSVFALLINGFVLFLLDKGYRLRS